nr:Transposase IS200 like [uncultured bacterium]
MSDKFQDQYRIESNRLKNWNFGWKKCYYLTICTRFNEYFGEIKDDKMIFTEIGKVAVNQWISTPDIRPDMNLQLDEFQVMPNHFHAIIGIGSNKFNSFSDHEYEIEILNPGLTETIFRKNKFGPQSKNISSICRGYKSSVTAYAKNHKILFDWQPNFYCNIINDEKSLIKVRNYILNNVKNWSKDRFNKNKIKS